MYVQADGLRLRYELDGPAGAPVVTFNHALGAELDMWKPQLDAFVDRFRVLRYDVRGHGGSDVPEGPYSLADLVEDLEALLQVLGIEQTHLVGLSMGGMIAQRFALEHPDMLSSLVLCDTTSEIPEQAKGSWDERIRKAEAEGMDPQVEPTVERWLTEDYRREHPETADWIRSMIRGTDPRGYIGCCHAIRELALTERLPEIQTPTLVVVGDQDPGTPPSVARAIHERIAGSGMHVIEGAAHLTNVQKAAEFNRVVHGFVSKHDRAL
jgi:3-oxoadipate enol-lactonase